MTRKSQSLRSGGLSVIVPTYEESTNIKALCTRLFSKLVVESGCDDVELIIVDDDSGADTVKTRAIVAEMQKLGHPIRIIVRGKGEGSGLSSAVLLGFDSAKYATLVCMDADLQHEPESVPGLAEAVLNGDSEFVVGSRNVEGGGVSAGWPLHRRIISGVATLLARPLSATTDPMSGFFCLPAAVYARGKATLNPIGYKVGLEISVRCRVTSVQDFAISFQERVSGESKLSMKQNFLYLQHLAILYWATYPITVLLAFTLLAAGAYYGIPIAAARFL